MQREQLEAAYRGNTFGVTRRTFLKAAAVAGVTALGGMLVFPAPEARCASGQSLPPATLDTAGSTIRFTVHSDTHFGTETRMNCEGKVRHAFATLYAMVPDIDAHIFVGDSVNNGLPEEYDALASLLNELVQKPIALVMGNHELYCGKGACGEFRAFLSSKLAVAGSPQIAGSPYAGRPFFDLELGGCHLIGASPEPGGYDNSWYGSSRDWIADRVASAAAENASAPIFLFTHHPFADSVWYSQDECQSGQFDEDGSLYRDLSATFPQLIHFSGHTHIPLADPRSIFQDDGFTAVQTATFAESFWTKGGEDEGYNGGSYDSDDQLDGHPGAGDDASQCLLVEVDKATQRVAIYRLDFRDEAFIGRPWTIDPSAGTAGFSYRRSNMEARSLPPIVEDDAWVSAAAGGEGVLPTFSLSADRIRPDQTGLEDDVVLAYRIEVIDPSGETVYDARFMSDYYRAQTNQAVVFTRTLIGADLESGSNCTLRAFALNVFGKESYVGATPLRA